MPDPTTAPASPATQTQPATGTPPTATDPAGGAGPATDGQSGAASPAAAAPAAPAEVNYEFKLPDGITFEPAILTEVTGIARDAKLPPETAQKFVDVGVRLAQGLQTKLEETITAQIATEKAAWKAALQADPDIGGAKTDQAMKDAQSALARARPGVKALFDSLGISEHPDVIHMLSVFGSRLSPDSFGDSKSNGGNGATPPARPWYDHPTSAVLNP